VNAIKGNDESNRSRLLSAPRLAVVADYALVDQSGKMSVLGIFQHIWVQQFPRCIRAAPRAAGSKKRTEIGEHGVQIRWWTKPTRSCWAASGTVNFAEPPRA